MFQDDRGLASAELLFVTLIALVIIAGTLSIINNQMGIASSGDLGQARVLGEKLAETINTVYVNGNGYSILFNIPVTSSSYPYVTANVTNSSGTGNVIMFLGSTSSTKKITIKIVPQKIQNATMTNNHTYAIKNNNGTINITQII
ncbi:hypothetical protein [uncultured Methanobacterium sp.]|uniref:hypothetical protein n=1 Tax=uncultured Methanobacterium sp. TaxID=176306 RepID=UPI002AA962F9|nr:hypothetical protein [uncultured Methanobacterium sp.]